MSPKQQEPTNREAFTKIIGQQTRARSPTWPICKQSNADAPKPPTYPFIHILFKERSFRQKFQGALNSSASSKAVSSDFPDRHNSVCRRFFPSPSLFRFGEAVFRSTRQNPQEEKTQASHFFHIRRLYYKILGLPIARPPQADRPRNFLAANPVFSDRLYAGPALRHQTHRQQPRDDRRIDHWLGRHDLDQQQIVHRSGNTHGIGQLV